jgi:hypothetical protein
MIFLIDYDRRASRVKSVQQFPDNERREAQNERLRLELSLQAERDREVVLLDAVDVAQLQETHRRYFEGGLETISLKAFIKRASETLRAFESRTLAEHKKDPQEFFLKRDEQDWWREVAAFVAVRDLQNRLVELMERAKDRDRSEMS